jgi:sugar lactone lactonase YvrE
MEIRTLAEGLEFPEGPVALADGSVLLVEIFAGTLTPCRPMEPKRSSRGREAARTEPRSVRTANATFATTAASDGTSWGRTDGR